MLWLTIRKTNRKPCINPKTNIVFTGKDRDINELMPSSCTACHRHGGLNNHVDRETNQRRAQRNINR
jgi:hypothetical protein